MILGIVLTAALAAARCALCLYGPDNMAFDSAGNLYLTDSDGKTNSRVLVLDPNGRLLAQWRIFTETAGERNGPEGIAIDLEGAVLVTDAGRKSVLEVAPSGRVLGAFGPRGGFPDLGHVAVDRDGDVYVAQAQPNSIEKYSPAGVLLSRWHRERGSGPEQWSGPEAIAIQNGVNLVVEDWRNRRVEILSPRGETLATFGRPGTGPGEFTNTSGIAVDPSGNVYVADIAAHRVQKFDPRGVWLATIGQPAATALFEQGPGSIAVDAHGDLYSADGLSVVKYAPSGELLARWR